ncbi:MAG: VOC family protein [Chitinophagaceae bacterium]
MLQGLRTIVYKVPDLEKARAWYSKIFGILPYFDEPFYVGFNVGGYELGLDPDKSRKVIVGNNSTTYWSVTDLRATMDLLKTQEVTIEGDVQNVGGGILVATITDPFGNSIGLIENPEFKMPS